VGRDGMRKQRTPNRNGATHAHRSPSTPPPTHRSIRPQQTVMADLVPAIHVFLAVGRILSLLRGAVPRGVSANSTQSSLTARGHHDGCKWWCCGPACRILGHDRVEAEILRGGRQTP
jgi:hypothetical protein